MATVRTILTTEYSLDDQIGRDLVNLLLVLAHYPYEPTRPSQLPLSVKAETARATGIWQKVRTIRRR